MSWHRAIKDQPIDRRIALVGRLKDEEAWVFFAGDANTGRGQRNHNESHTGLVM
jgi:hypothetical protein